MTKEEFIGTVCTVVWNIDSALKAYKHLEEIVTADIPDETSGWVETALDHVGTVVQALNKQLVKVVEEYEKEN